MLPQPHSRRRFFYAYAYAILVLMFIGGCNGNNPLTTDNRNQVVQTLIPTATVTILRAEDGTAYAVRPMTNDKYSILLIQNCVTARCRSVSTPDKLFSDRRYTVLSTKAGQKFAVRSNSSAGGDSYEVILVNDAIDNVITEQELSDEHEQLSLPPPSAGFDGLEPRPDAAEPAAPDTPAAPDLQP